MSEQTHVAVITGAGRGIGRAIAIEFAKAGYDCAVLARSPDQLRDTAAEVEKAGRKCLTLPTDLSDWDHAGQSIAQAANELGRLDVLVNNAGVAPLAPIETFDLAELRRTLDLNIGAVFVCCKAAWPIMKAAAGGTIINISSVSAQDPFPHFAVYGASKAAVNTLSTALAAEGRPHNIRVFALGPGAVETELLRETFPDLPAEQCLDPDDVAAFATMLADPRCRYVTGQPIYIRKS
jgi:NAD(P)-dependent dehydrogenase (short-subunit alcohol dehydrogenase family)